MWRNINFEPPNDVQFLGDTILPDLPTRIGNVTPHTLFKMFITVEMLQSMVDKTNPCGEK